MRSPSRRQLFFAVLFGLIVAAGMSAPLVAPTEPVSGFQMTAADLLLWHPYGPHLAYRGHLGDVVRVEIGNTTPEQDALVYATLLEMGAKAVADPRPSGTGEADKLVALLKAMPGAAGHVLRHMQPTTGDLNVSKEDRKQYSGTSDIYQDAAHDVNKYVRYYPLVRVDDDGLVEETLAVKVARIALGLPFENALTTAYQAGIVGRWINLAYKDQIDKFPEDVQDAQSKPTRPYDLGGGYTIPWVWHPSVEFPPLVSPASMWINYRSQPGQDVHFTAADVLAGKVPGSAIANKIVIVDMLATFFPVPTTTRFATWGEIEEEVIEQILDQSYLVPEGQRAIAPVVLLALIGACAFVLLEPLIALGFAAASFVLYMGAAVAAYKLGTFPDLFLAPVALVLSSTGVGLARYAQETIQRRRVYDMFGRYVPRTVVADLVKRPAARALALGGTKREITVLFADVRGFTTYSSHVAPEEVLVQLNKVLSSLVASAFAEQGTVDKYIGDAIMVLFNAPLDQADHGERAVRAALRMQQALSGGSLAVGVGVHSGDAVVGNVGTRERLEYTAIGATVNMAARLCESAGRGEVIISSTVRELLAEKVRVEQRDPIHAKGIAEPLTTYRVLGMM